MEYARDIVIAISALAVAFFAWLGLKAWRKELVGKERFQIARRMMHASFELQDRFEWVRHPLTLSNEWIDRGSQTGESDSEKEVLNEWHAKSKRLGSLRESFNKLVEVRWEAEILLDDNSVVSMKEAIDSLRKSYADVSSAISSYFEIRLDEARTGDTYNNQDFIRELRNTIYSSGQDDFITKVNDAVDKLSSTLKQYVR